MWAKKLWGEMGSNPTHVHCPNQVEPQQLAVCPGLTAGLGARVLPFLPYERRGLQVTDCLVIYSQGSGSRVRAGTGHRGLVKFQAYF